jgi:phage baseplate assembly protein W
MTGPNHAIDSVRYPFGVDAGAGRLAQEPDYAQHVEQMIKQVLLTAPGERINRPDFGCGLRQMVFAPNSDAAAQLLRVMVQQAVERWLDSVITVDTVDVLATNEVLQVRLVYVLKARGDRRYLNLEVTP